MNNLENQEKKNQYNIKTKIVKALKYITNTILLLFMILVVILMFSSLNGKFGKQASSIGGYKFYAVFTQSMKPKIGVGSLVIVKPVNPNDLRKGDIITFTNNDLSTETITHRIVDIKKEDTLSFVTKGDANNANDDNLVLANNVAGKVLFSIPYIAKFLYFLKTPLGIIMLIVIPSICIGIMEIIKLLKHIRILDKNEEVNPTEQPRK